MKTFLIRILQFILILLSMPGASLVMCPIWIDAEWRVQGFIMVVVSVVSTCVFVLTTMNNEELKKVKVFFFGESKK